MAEFDSGIGMDEAGIDAGDMGIGGDEALGAPAEGAPDGVAAGSDDPWAWTQEVGMTPEQIRDSVTNYTKKTQALSEQARALEPYQQLMEELQGDVNLQNIIREYYQSGKTPEAAVNNLESELRTLQTKIALDEEFKELGDFVSEKGLPGFEKQEVLSYAVDNNIGSMIDAYKAMKFDEAQAAARASLENDIKKGRQAAVPKSGRSDDAGNARPTVDDIAGMSEEEFLKGYNGLVRGIVGA